MAVAIKPKVCFTYHDNVRIAQMLLFAGSDPATLIHLLLLLPRQIELALVLMLLYPIGLAYVFYLLLLPLAPGPLNPSPPTTLPALPRSVSPTYIESHISSPLKKLLSFLLLTLPLFFSDSVFH
jgi:hypothetical protein